MTSVMLIVNCQYCTAGIQSLLGTIHVSKRRFIINITIVHFKTYEVVGFSIFSAINFFIESG